MESSKEEVIKRKDAWIIIFFFLLQILIFNSCSTPGIAPYAQNIDMPTEDLEKGRRLFNHHCATCHPQGKSGLGPSIINKPLPEALIRFQIRKGIGVMPAFNEDNLTDDQVKTIAEYVVYLRRQD